MTELRIDETRQRLQDHMMPIFTELDNYDIPAGKEKNIIDFTVNFYSRNQHMRFSRIIRKVVDQYHLKLKTN